MKKPIIISAVATGIVLMLFLGLVYVNPIEKPWSSMNCDEMLELALSPEHNSFSEKQH